MHYLELRIKINPKENYCLVKCQGAQSTSMKGVLILFVTAIVMCVGNRTHGVHRHGHARTGLKPERDTGSIILKPGTAKNKLFPGYGTNFRYIGEVKNGLDRVSVVNSNP